MYLKTSLIMRLPMVFTCHIVHAFWGFLSYVIPSEVKQKENSHKVHMRYDKSFIIAHGHIFDISLYPFTHLLNNVIKLILALIEGHGFPQFTSSPCIRGTDSMVFHRQGGGSRFSWKI